MRNNLLVLAFTLMLASCASEPALAKGFSPSYGSSRSYSRPSYSAPRQAAPVRQAPTVTKNITVNKTTVVHEHNGYGGGNGLLTGLMVGSMLNNSNNRPVVVEQAPPAYVQAPSAQDYTQQAPPVVAQQEESHWFLWLVVLGLVGILAYHAVKETD